MRLKYGGEMRLFIGAVTCFAVAVAGYVARGDDYVGNYKNGGLHDWVTTLVIYGALVALVVVGVVALARGLRRFLPSTKQHHGRPSS